MNISAVVMAKNELFFPLKLRKKVIFNNRFGFLLSPHVFEVSPSVYFMSQGENEQEYLVF